MLRSVAIAVVAASVLAACGGGGGDDGANSQKAVLEGGTPGTVVSASTPPCGEVDVHDSGRITYLLLQRECTWTSADAFLLSVQTASGARLYPLRLSELGDSSVLATDDGLRRVVSVHRKGSWVKHANEDSWDWRDGAGLLVKDGLLYLLGGYRANEGSQNEVWASSDARNWTRLVEIAPWTGRHGAGWVVHGDRLWVIGGDLETDVWSSQDGLSWEQMTGNAPFAARYTPNAVSDGKRMILYAGQTWSPVNACGTASGCEAVGFNDVWASSDGKRWQRLIASAPWEGRGLIHGGVWFNGRIYLVGGGLKDVAPGATVSETAREFSDIWSSADGVQWRREATELGFAPRTHFSIVATPHGCFVSDGSVGTQAGFSSEVHFAPDCVRFEPIPDPSPMERRHASSLAWFNGSIVILGGPPLGGPETTAGTTVWQYFPDLP
jgi:hypothetical protein